MLTVASSSGSSGSAIGGVLGFVVFCALIWWGVKRFRARGSASGSDGEDNVVLRALRSLVRLYTLPLRFLNPFMSSTHASHRDRLKDLEKSDLGKKREPPASLLENGPAEQGAGGFELPEYGPIDPTDRE